MIIFLWCLIVWFIFNILVQMVAMYGDSEGSKAAMRGFFMCIEIAFLITAIVQLVKLP